MWGRAALLYASAWEGKWIKFPESKSYNCAVLNKTAYAHGEK